MEVVSSIGMEHEKSVYVVVYPKHAISIKINTKNP